MNKTNFPVKDTIFQSSLAAAFFFSIAFTGYGTVYLQGLGFETSQIGTINACANVISIFACIFFGIVSDKINSIKKVLLFATLLFSALYSAIPLLPIDTSYTFVMFLLYFTLINCFKAPFGSLCEGMLARSSYDLNLNYGFVRSWGSIGYAVSGFILSYIVSTFGINTSFIINAIITVPILVLISFSYDPKVEKKTKHQKISIKPLFKNLHYVFFLVFTFFLWMTISSDITFAPYFMEEIGVASDNLGVYLSIRALFEIPILLLINKLRSKINLKYILMFSSFFYAVQYFLMGFWPTTLMDIIILSALSGVGSGLMVGSVSLYVLELAPPELRASAQSVYSSVVAASGILGNLLGGYIYEIFKGRMYYIFLGVVVTLGAILFLASNFIKKKERI